MFGKIAIRNIPSDIWEALGSMAALHERSTEGEARYALRAWAEPFLNRKERSARRSEVSARLRSVLDEVNAARRGSHIRPSHLAQAIGENYAEVVENWFTGEVEPSFSQLAATADYLGAVPEWLQHGGGHIFPVESGKRLSEDPFEAVTWLLDLGSDSKLTNLYFVRENSESGSLMIVKEYPDYRCKTFTTPYHVSDEIGAGGETALAHLSVTWELLYKKYGSARCGTHVGSYIIAPEKFKALYKGNTHPLVILRDAPSKPWWEDFWDMNQIPNQTYWTGWQSLCTSIQRVVESKTHLKEQRALIRSGEHPILKVKN
jgi:plasmid stability protein